MHLPIILTTDKERENAHRKVVCHHNVRRKNKINNSEIYNTAFYLTSVLKGQILHGQ